MLLAHAAHLDPRFVSFPNLPEDEYESILAVPVLARDRLEGALNVRTRLPRAFADDEVELLCAIAGQVGQAIENAKLYDRLQRRVSELESLTVREIHHRVKNNLQTVASLLRLQARTLEDEPAQRALDESVNRILSIAAVHDLATASHDDDIDCADLVGRLEVTLGHGLGGRPVASSLEPVTLSGARANALALVFCELFGNAVEHGTGRIEVALRRDGDQRRAGGRRRGARPVAGAQRRPGADDRPRAGSRGAARAARAAGKGGGTVSGRVLIAEDETIIRLDIRVDARAGGLRGGGRGARRPRGGRAGGRARARPGGDGRQDAASSTASRRPAGCSSGGRCRSSC